MLAIEKLEEAFERDFRSASDNYKALCPFHDERTPSFYVHSIDLISNCFGCGVAGYVDTLLARYKGISKDEARLLLDIKPSDYLQAGKPRAERVPQYFPESWLSPWKKEVHSYVLRRGLSLDYLKAVDSRWDHSQKRQVFPHRDREGRLLGVVGRTVQGREPKWLFYWDYDKGSSLYRPIERGNQEGSRTNDRTLRSPLVVVEGVFDYLWLKQNGVVNVCATLGTKFTKAQCREIRSLTNEVIIGYDQDQAGREASENLYRRLSPTCSCKFYRYPAYVKDVMDLQDSALEEVISSPLNYVQRSLISKAEASSRNAVQQT